MSWNFTGKAGSAEPRHVNAYSTPWSSSRLIYGNTTQKLLQRPSYLSSSRCAEDRWIESLLKIAHFVKNGRSILRESSQSLARKRVRRPSWLRQSNSETTWPATWSSWPCLLCPDAWMRKMKVKQILTSRLRMMLWKRMLSKRRLSEPDIRRRKVSCSCHSSAVPMCEIAMRTCLCTWLQSKAMRRYKPLFKRALTSARWPRMGQAPSTRRHEMEMSRLPRSCCNLGLNKMQKTRADPRRCIVQRTEDIGVS